jgi:dCMP deaminase
MGLPPQPPPQTMTPYSRLDLDTYFLQMAELVANRSTCRRRAVGCVLVDSSNHVVSTGYNGVPTHFPHCLDTPCEGASAPSGTSLEKCLAVHAEQNALLQLRSNDALTAYLTVSPCITCAKMIANSRIRRIVASHEYAQSFAVDILNKAKIMLEFPRNDNSHDRNL